MSEVKVGRWRAEIDGDFVVFLIGARANRVRPFRCSATSVAGEECSTC